MAIETSFALLFENLKLEDPWLPPRPWESIPSESGSSHQNSSSSLFTPLYDTSCVSEASLVRLAINALQGVEAALISIRKISESFCSEPSDRTFHRLQNLWSRTLSTHALGKILNSIHHSGRIVFLLHKFVDFLTDLTSEESQKQPSHSLVNQAFAVAVKKLLEGYNSAMDTLYNSACLRGKKGNKSSGFVTSIDYSQVTLLEIYLHSKGLRTQIEALGNICCLYDLDVCSSIPFSDDFSIKEKFSNFPRGGDLLTYLYSQLKVSDPAHCALLKFLFLQSFEPYCEFIRSWIYKAKIRDPYNEFVVNCMDIQLPNSVAVERAGVAVPCFLKELLIPLVRAGQQFQVVMKLLELSDNGGTWNRTYEDFLPYWTGFYNGSPVSHASPLVFTKLGIESIVLARNSYYKKMMDKLQHLPTQLDFRYQQVVPHGFANYVAKSKKPSVPSAIDDTLSIPAAEKTDQELNSKASSSVSDAWDSDECSSINSSEDENHPHQQEIQLPVDIIMPDQKYFSSLRFSSNVSNITLFPDPQEIDNCQPHIPCYGDVHNYTEDQNPRDSYDCSESWTVKYNSDFLSMNPVVNKNSLVQATDKHEENFSSEYKNNTNDLPFIDFASVVDPFLSLGTKLDIRSTYQYGIDRSVVTEPPINKEGYNGNKTESPREYLPVKSTFGQSEKLLSTDNLGGEYSWESLLGNSGKSVDFKNKDLSNSLAVILDIPLDFVMAKCLLEEILLQYRYVSKLTIKLLEEGFNLREHLLALRRFHFMELADWADLFLMNLLNQKWCITEADRRISEIQSLLELSIQRSSCEKARNKDRLYVYVKKQSIMALSASVSGIHSLDFLGLGYRVDWPVNIVLTPVTLTLYGDIFNFLIQIKLGLSSLAQVWCSLKDLKHIINQNRYSESHELHVHHFDVLMKLRQQVNHFVATLQQYVHSQLSHVCWSKFQHSLNYEVKDMMDLESVHMAYLIDSLQVCFLSDEARLIASILQSILECAFDFRCCLNGNITELKYDNRYLQSKFSPINITQVFAIKRMFDKNMKELYQCYCKSPRHVEFGLSGFWDYLNYNGYYSDIV